MVNVRSISTVNIQNIEKSLHGKLLESVNSEPYIDVLARCY